MVGSVALVSKYVRRFLIEQGGEQCSVCGWHERNPRTGRVPLDVDHIDGNYADNSPANVRLLCPNCHALTPTYKGMNRGRGDPTRSFAANLKKSRRRESNPRPAVYKTAALAAELRRQWCACEYTIRSERRTLACAVL